MKFLNEEFLLSSDLAKKLYHEYAEKQPIIDYHCHIVPSEIRDDIRFENITKLWLGADHYKWRLMRANGVSEDLITGNASDHDKFVAFAKTLERAVGNPVFIWSHLELYRYFGYDGVLCGDTAEEVWNLCNEILKQPEYSARGIMKLSGVELICTTDDPVDSLEHHEAIAADESFDIKVLPAFRPDRAVDIEKEDFAAYVKKVGEAAGHEIKCINCLKNALRARMDFFAEHDCSVADHGMGLFVYEPASNEVVADIFARAYRGEKVSDLEAKQYKTAMLKFFAAEYAKRGWMMQLHYGVKRENNVEAFKALGANAGLDCIANGSSAADLANFLNDCTAEKALPKTVVYSLDPNEDAIINTVIACFQEPGTWSDARQENRGGLETTSNVVRGKLQHGAAWWFNDHRLGIEAHMKRLAADGLLGNFIGMLTDSRSFVSYTRHEYFRRILCNVLADFAIGGDFPEDEKLLGKLASDISYGNISEYLGK
ncbi:MAG: glucuronate isomerase [Lachnospiraceae bacterium]|nr:glucuronate isomerase [Lachnospiraceae bacterium]